jgi:HlyD family secretion protein
MKRWLTWLAVILVVGGATAAGAYPMMKWWEDRNAPKYLTATVSRGRVETVVNSTGTVKAVRTVSVGAFTSGPIKEIKVDFNSEITQVGNNEWLIQTGDKAEKVNWLALIDDKLQSAAVDRDKAAVKAQEADLKKLKVQHRLAKSKWEAGKNLNKKGKQVSAIYISRLELEELESNVDSLAAQIELSDASIRQANANLKNSEDQLRYTKIFPPEEINSAKGVKGKVIDRKVDPGQTVVGTFQTAEMFTIALEMDKHIHVYASVDEADIGMIRAAAEGKQAVSFTVDAYPSELFIGTIHDIRLNSTTMQNVVTYPVIIDAANKEQKLKPGMTASITFPIEAKEGALRVPIAALRYTPNKDHVYPEDRHYLEAITSGSSATGVKRTADEKAGMARDRSRRVVWIQEDKLLRAVPVTLGLMDHRYAELLNGDLRDGQTVVTGIESNLAPR